MNFSYKDLEILFEDKNIIVVKKPSGVPSESAEISKPDMVRTLKNYLTVSGAGSEPYLALLHRLDQPVEGIMVFGKTKAASAKLSADIKSGRFTKEYLAACYPMKSGTFARLYDREDEDGPEFLLEDHLLRGSGNMVQVVSQNTPGAKAAKLYCLPLKEIYTLRGGGTEIRLARIRLLTGRHHQIRVQLSHAGLPIIGDRKYGCMPDAYKGSLCLAAVGLTFIHPKTKESMHFEITPAFIGELEEASSDIIDNPHRI